ncbi:MAG TPA: hypothetical protein VF461_09340 [Gemmatimonadaceae bacterium]
MREQLAPHHREDLDHQTAQVNGCRGERLVPDETTDPLQDDARSLARFHDVIQNPLEQRAIDWLDLFEHAFGQSGVADDDLEGLTHFMRDGAGELADHGNATEMRHLALLLPEILLRDDSIRHVRRHPDQLVVTGALVAQHVADAMEPSCLPIGANDPEHFVDPPSFGRHACEGGVHPFPIFGVHGREQSLGRLRIVRPESEEPVHERRDPHRLVHEVDAPEADVRRRRRELHPLRADSHRTSHAASTDPQFEPPHDAPRVTIGRIDGQDPIGHDPADRSARKTDAESDTHSTAIDSAIHATPHACAIRGMNGFKELR